MRKKIGRMKKGGGYKMVVQKTHGYGATATDTK